jgi:hypothetical protein
MYGIIDLAHSSVHHCGMLRYFIQYFVFLFSQSTAFYIEVCYENFKVNCLMEFIENEKQNFKRDS